VTEAVNIGIVHILSDQLTTMVSGYFNGVTSTFYDYEIMAGEKWELEVLRMVEIPGYIRDNLRVDETQSSCPGCSPYLTFNTEILTFQVEGG